MINKELENLINTRKERSNKDLANNLIILKDDFEKVKTTIVRLSTIMKEIETAYDSVYDELRGRLKFEDKNEG